MNAIRASAFGEQLSCASVRGYHNLSFTVAATTLFLALAFPLTTVDAQNVEIVPGLTAVGGFQRIGFDRSLVLDPKEGPDEMAQVSHGTVQWWTRLHGNNQTLDVLGRPGILPVHHDWVRKETITVRTIAVRNVGAEKKLRDSTWFPNYIQLLRNEMRQRRGVFTSSAISRPAASLERGEYRITILARNGKKLAGSNGKPLSWNYNHQP